MVNHFLYNQMYALCLLAALSLRQHVHQNWQATPAKRIPSQPSFSFLKCIDSGDSLRTKKVRKNHTDIDECDYQGPKKKSQDFLLTCFRKLTEGANTIIDNIGASVNSSKVVNNPWSKNILDSMLLLSGKFQDKCWA